MMKDLNFLTLKPISPNEYDTTILHSFCTNPSFPFFTQHTTACTRNSPIKLPYRFGPLCCINKTTIHKLNKRIRDPIGIEEQLFHGNTATLGEDEAVYSRASLLVGEGNLEDDEELTMRLSLIEKPDRSMSLLDDYEMEELGFPTDNPNHRSGYVAVLGKPNVGKSTLSNQMVGQKLSIVTDKPQTTRHRILGICSTQEYQMILYDTPGVIEKKMHKLDSMMMNNVRSAGVNADCALVVVDACKAPEKIAEVLEGGAGILKDKLPVLLVLNKKDLIKPGEIAKKLQWYEKFTDVDEVIPVSAKYGHGVDDVKDWILSKLPLGPAYYPKDIASEHPERFFIAEIVREKIFIQFRNEVPYSSQVNVISYKTRPNAKDFIQIEIVVEKDSQKIILIGKDGQALKLLASAARLDIEDFLQKKVFLEVEVKVKKNWRQNEGLLKHYGYSGGGGIRTN